MAEFISQAVGATLVTLGMIAAYMFYVFKVQGKSFGRWKGAEGKGAVASAGLGVGSIILIAFIIFMVSSYFTEAKAESFKNGTWNNYTAVYLGIDYTFNVSPQCREASVDEHGTSNLGVTHNIWQSQKGVFAVNGKYTHHSCVIGKDRNGYDGAGLQLVWYFKH